MTPENQNIELLAGQRLMVGFEGTELNNELKTLIRDIKVGGIILFAINIQSAAQVKALCKSAQEYAKSCNLPPLVIAVDQEGGDVARLKKPDFTEFPGNPHITDIDSAKIFGSIVANELKSVHINMNFAPVMDSIPKLNTMPANFKSVMLNRVFPGNPENVATLGSHVIDALQKNGIMAVAKHFPGIGRTTRDSHLELPVLKTEEADQNLMEKSDFIPFKAAIKSNVAGIMLSHILYTSMDNEWPASLSYNIAKRVLRDQMGYQGVVMTDDLDMKAIKYDIKTSIRQILNADIDIAMICHKSSAIETAFNEIVKLITTYEEFYRKALNSSLRIDLLKKTYLV
ncbi:MAG: beta-N-acetylhexosaminidase [Desulfamplus sp.]|nr:beta-N-acetylhexosaminidase [Desulfamplus sp.]MBF0412067.1 beta-N-acetylhexosaminidase [Desulfamplus sp.]